MKQLFSNSGLVDKDEYGASVFPDMSRISNGRVAIAILNSQHPEDFEKSLRGMGEILGLQVIGLENISGNLYFLEENLMPSIVTVEDAFKPNFRCFYLGINEAGNSVTVETEHSAGMTIAGASRSGKSVAIKAIVETYLASTPRTLVTLLDPKRVSFTKMFGSFKEVNIVRDLKEASESISGLLDEMNRRYLWLEENLMEKITEANDAGQDWTYQMYIIDESQDWLATPKKSEMDKEVYEQRWLLINSVNELMRKGAAVGFFGIFAAQAGQADVLPNDVRTNSLIKLSFAMPSDALGAAFFGNGCPYKMSDKTLIRGKGVLVDPINGFNKLQVLSLD